MMPRAFPIDIAIARLGGAMSDRLQVECLKTGEPNDLSSKVKSAQFFHILFPLLHRPA
jgi:hypothetical protein